MGSLFTISQPTVNVPNRSPNALEEKQKNIAMYAANQIPFKP